jgi:hypothetical protein
MLTDILRVRVSFDTAGRPFLKHISVITRKTFVIFFVQSYSREDKIKL